MPYGDWCGKLPCACPFGKQYEVKQDYLDILSIFKILFSRIKNICHDYLT